MTNHPDLPAYNRQRAFEQPPLRQRLAQAGNSRDRSFQE